MCIRFIFVLPVFVFGSANNFFGLAYDLQDTHNLPFEGYTKSLRIFFSTVVPIIIVNAMSVSVMLGRSNGILMTLWAFVVMTVFLFIIIKLWSVSLRNYTSASS